MNLLVIGANGKTGQAIVQQAGVRGHSVTAFAHHTPPATMHCARVIVGDARDIHLLDSAIAGQDAVIDTVGTRKPFLKTTLETDIAEALVAAMRPYAVSRVLAVSSIGVGDSIGNVPLLYRALMPIFFRGAMPDKEGMEAQIRQSGLDWTIVRPAGLTDGPATGSVQVVDPASGRHVRRISRADVAGFLLDALLNVTLYDKVVGIATK